MPTEKERAWEAYQARKRAYQSVYDNFRYTDAQRERVIDFIGAAMKVIRGDAKFESLERLIPVARKNVEEIDGEAYRGGSRYAFDARFLNDWTSIYMLGTTDAQGKVEPYHFQIDFRPEMTIQRERLEQLLQLKVAPGWTSDGGNLRPPVPLLHGSGTFNGGYFVYDILNPPCMPYTVKVEFTYLNGPDKDARTATTLAHLEIRRDYLRPEEIQERDNKRFGHLPQTSERCTKSGAPDPFDEEIERMFDKRKG